MSSLKTPVGMTLMNVLHDPSIYVDPFTFKPERWLDDHADLEQLDRFLVAFGRGDRMCIGMRYASAAYALPLFPTTLAKKANDYVTISAVLRTPRCISLWLRWSVALILRSSTQTVRGM